MTAGSAILHGFGAGLVAVALWLAPTAGHVEASTCSYIDVPDPRGRLSSALESSRELVLVGSVTAETRVELDGRRWDPVELKPAKDQSFRDDDRSTYRSTVKIESVLAGDYASDEITLHWLSEVWTCNSGPRLVEGARVLLLLHEAATWTQSDQRYGLFWQTGLIGGQVILSDGIAYMDDYPANGEPQSMGDASVVIREVGKRLDSPPDAIDQALTAVAPTPNGYGFTWTPVLSVLGIALIAVVLGIVATAIRRRATNND